MESLTCQPSPAANAVARVRRDATDKDPAADARMPALARTNVSVRMKAMAAKVATVDTWEYRSQRSARQLRWQHLCCRQSQRLLLPPLVCQSLQTARSTNSRSGRDRQLSGFNPARQCLF